MNNRFVEQASEVPAELSSELAIVGRHFLIGLQKSPTLTEHDVKLLSALQPAGIILFRENFRRDVPYAEWLASYRELIDGVKSCIKREHILISIDHEGGSVFRTPPPITNFGPAASWAAASGSIGAAVGEELRSLGINLNYAPVVDIHTNPANPVIGKRALGMDSETVAENARNFLVGQELEGVMASPKHFPGHGDTSVDSHYELPIVRRTLGELRQRELLPFAAMVKAGARIIMSAHILYPEIDAEYPATLSRFWLNDILRGELGFQGAITTDDTGMGAVSALFSKPGAAVRAIEAGCDLIMMSAHWTNTNRIAGLAQDLLEGLKSGSLNRKAFEASQERIENLLASARTHPIRELPEAVFAAHNAMRTV